MRTSYFTYMFIRAGSVGGSISLYGEQTRREMQLSFSIGIKSLKILCENCFDTRACSESYMNKYIESLLKNVFDRRDVVRK